MGPGLHSAGRPDQSPVSHEAVSAPAGQPARARASASSGHADATSERTEHAESAQSFRRSDAERAKRQRHAKSIWWSKYRHAESDTEYAKSFQLFGLSERPTDAE